MKKGKVVDDNQRVIIIDNEHFALLFDALCAGISLERDTLPVPIEIDDEEGMAELSTVLEDICELVIGMVSQNAMETMDLDHKTHSLIIKDSIVHKAIETFIEDSRDDLTGIVAEQLKPTLANAIIEMFNEFIRELAIFNIKKITLKTKKHALVLC